MRAVSDVAVPAAQPNGEQSLLWAYYQLCLAVPTQAQLKAVATSLGLSMVAVSTMRAADRFLSSATDTFEDYEDMQAVPLTTVQRLQNTVQRVSSFLGSSGDQGLRSLGAWGPGGGAASEAQAAAKPGMQMDGSQEPLWDNRVTIDESVDEHWQDIDDYGDGGAGVRINSVVGARTDGAAPSHHTQPANGSGGGGGGGGGGYSAPTVVMSEATRRLQQAAVAAGATGRAAARLAEAAVESTRSMAAAAAAAVSSGLGPQQTTWTALDSADARIIVVLAGADVRVALKSTGHLVPFEGNRSALINPVVQMDARHLFMQLTPLVLEAEELGLRVVLTGSGAGGSLAGVLALMYAAHTVDTDAPLEAVLFNALPTIGEVVPEGSGEGEASRLEEVMQRGLLPTLGLPSRAIRSVVVGGTGSSAGGAGAAPSSHKPSAAELVARLAGALAARATNRGGGGSGADKDKDTPVEAGSGSGGAEVSVRRCGTDGKRLTVFKPLGTILSLSRPMALGST
ncbi:hypothetical protein FOA52_015651 [Chlamydomonas sp. UWO 241]|nr:hypothetical protein FOA52_015651 [Chlamydomonas sp. UWO 241]